MSFFVHSLKALEGLYVCHSAKKFTRHVPNFKLVPLSLACGSSLRDHWQTDWINLELWETIGLTTSSQKAAGVFSFPDYSHQANTEIMFASSSRLNWSPSVSQDPLIWTITPWNSTLLQGCNLVGRGHHSWLPEHISATHSKRSHGQI